MKVIYIIGPFRAETPWLVEQNIRAAETMALEVARAGAAPLCVHSMTRFFDKTFSDQYWLDATLEIMRRADAVLCLPGWERSRGSQAEVLEAERRGMPVLKNIQEMDRWLGTSS